jgi:glycosyltransferase involved in cell wall biosynthesis
VYTALHSVYRHKDKTVCEAVVPNIIVHTDLARDALVNEKKVAGKIHIIPHGCLEPKDQEPLWNIYKTDHTFMQFGFGFEYKGWETSLEVCAELKKKYPDVFFTGVFSESKFSKGFHDRYFDRLQSLIDKLDIRQNVAFLRGFQSEEVLESLFRLNRCLLLPYVDGGDHQVLAVTGAARVAMRSGIPVVTSKVPFFSDLKGVCPQADSVHGFESCIEDAWRDSKEQVIKQNEFLVKNSWQNVAQMYLKAFTV